MARGHNCGFHLLRQGIRNTRVNITVKGEANGIDVLRDDIVIENMSFSLFLKNGFSEEYRTEEINLLKKEMRESLSVYGTLKSVWVYFSK